MRRKPARVRPGRKQLSKWIRSRIYDELERVAETEGKSQCAIVEAALLAYFRRPGEPTTPNPS